jgi:hypothetical protein
MSVGDSRGTLRRPDGPGQRSLDIIDVSVRVALNAVSNDDDEEADEHSAGGDDTEGSS